jgi:hypothetical protein
VCCLWMPCSMQNTSNCPRHVLSTLVIPRSAQFRSSDILSSSLELLECSKGLRFSLQEVNCLEARVVIDESDPVAIPLICGTFTGPWTSLWTSWRSFEALEVDGGKGSACILPALQASHTLGLGWLLIQA